MEGNEMGVQDRVIGFYADAIRQGAIENVETVHTATGIAIPYDIADDAYSDLVVGKLRAAYRAIRPGLRCARAALAGSPEAIAAFGRDHAATIWGFDGKGYNFPPAEAEKEEIAAKEQLQGLTAGKSVALRAAAAAE
ncbi:MAG TPA: hypothetical protein VJB16_05085, partial [archaeon]|nr:hypothetical protein [archaeon]